MSDLRFEEGIAPLFREKDIMEMQLIGGYDLVNYTDVKQRAGKIYQHLSDGSLPFDGLWLEDQIRKLKHWMEQGRSP